MERPDGPWAWGVLTAVMVAQGLVLGFPSAIGVFFTDLQSSFSATNTETGWLPSIIMAVLHAGGPLCSIMVEKFGCRVAVIVGGLLCGIGMVASSFSQSIVHMYISVGFVGGLGLCFCFQATVTVLGYYFIKRRTLANSLASTGASIGMALWPLAGQYLLETMGWRNSFMIFGGVLLNCCVCGAIMRPVKAPKSAPPNDASSSQPGAEKSSEELEEGKGLQRFLAFDLLFHHRRYQIYAIGITWLVLGFVLPLFYLVPYATSQGIEENMAALLLALIGFIQIFARPLAGIISQQKIFSKKLIYLLSGSMIVNGLSNLVCAASVTFPTLLIYVGLYSISMGIIGSLVFQVLMDIVGMKRFPGAFGLFTIMQSITILLGPPLAGALVDISGQYSHVFYFSTFAVASSGLFVLVASYLVDRKEGRLNQRLQTSVSENGKSHQQKLQNIIYQPAKQEEAE